MTFAFIDEHAEDAVQYANARLMAAAPELLDALQHLLDPTVSADRAHGVALSDGRAEAWVRAPSAIA